MIELNENEVPILQKSFNVDNELQMVGVTEPGVIVQYMERDKAVLIFWEEIIAFGMQKPAEPVPPKKTNRIEIDTPRKKVVLHERVDKH